MTDDQLEWLIEGADHAPEGAAFSTLPSVLSRNVHGCFMDDVLRARHVREIGIENVMVETDSPHTASSRPHSMQTARERLAHLTDEEQYLVLQGNARRVFDLEPAAIPGDDHVPEEIVS